MTNISAWKRYSTSILCRSYCTAPLISNFRLCLSYRTRFWFLVLHPPGISVLHSRGSRKNRKRSRTHHHVGIRTKLLIADWDFCQKFKCIFFPAVFSLVLVYPPPAALWGWKTKSGMSIFFFSCTLVHNNSTVLGWYWTKHRFFSTTASMIYIESVWFVRSSVQTPFSFDVIPSQLVLRYGLSG